MAKLSKEKKDKSNIPHFNAVDAMIIILLVVALVGIYFRYNIIDFLTADKNNDEYAVSFSVDDIRYTTPNYLSIDDKVYFKSTGNIMGNIITESKDNQAVLNITPAKKYFTDSKGDIKEVSYPEQESRVDAKGRLLCLGSYSADSGFCIDGNTYIAPGQYVEVYTEMVTLTLKITDIAPYESEK